MRESLGEITRRGEWSSYAEALLSAGDVPPALAEALSSYWIEAGHRVREQIADDRQLVRLLRHVLSPYKGGGAVLYRGENLDRWTAKRIGLAWTLDYGTARTFARGWNAVESGGVILRGHFAPVAIISGPNPHSVHLGEHQFTVDPLRATDLEALDQFPAVE